MNKELSFVDQQMMNGKGGYADSLQQAVDDKKCREWAMILADYKSGKSNLEDRMRKNQEYWRGRHWRTIRQQDAANNEYPEPTSAWLTNVILAKHSARMDAYPEATVLPRELNDVPEAENLTSILPSIMDMVDFKKTYSQVGWDKMISCAGCYCVTWDASKHNGLGDIDISAVDLMNVYWQPGITDIQQSKYVFVVKLVDNDTLIEQYPNIQLKIGGSKIIEPTKYVYEDNVDTSKKECVVDVYYKKKNAEGKTVLHFAKFVRDILLYSTENDPQLSITGLYNHGKYPFVIEPVYPIKGSIAGFGYVDICRDPQDYIDIMGSSILRNCIESATPRYFIRSDAGINVEEFNNLTRRVITANGNLAEDAVRVVDTNELSSNVLNYYQYKIDEMKQTAGNRDAANGGTEAGVTAASALAIMQESGNALSRDENNVAYEAFRDIVELCIELIRQFYQLPRFFRIRGERGVANYITYTNARLVEQSTPGMDGLQYFRLPEFDLDITCAASSEYSKNAQNNLALQFYQAGFFNPMNAVMTLACLDMMDFKGKDKMYATVQQLGMMAMAAPQPTEDGGDVKTADTMSGESDAQERAEKKKAQAKESAVNGSVPR